MADVGQDLLVVASSENITNFEPSNEALLQVAADLLDAELPAPYTSEGLKDLAMEAGMLAVGLPLGRPVAELLVETVGRHYQRSQFEEWHQLSPEQRGARLVDVRELVVALMLELLFRSPLGQNAMPGLRVLQADDEELDQLTCADGRFTPFVVYAAHPRNENYYFRLADYHPSLVKDKRAEFIDLAASLGAKRITLLAENGASTEGNVHAGVEGVSNVASASAEAGGHSRTRKGFEVAVEFTDLPLTPPRLPESTHWLATEPLWNTMANARLNYWVTSFRVKFSYASDFGINAEFEAGVKGLGLKAGGEFHQQKNVDQEYLVEFWPRDSYPDATPAMDAHPKEAMVEVAPSD